MTNSLSVSGICKEASNLCYQTADELRKVPLTTTYNSTVGFGVPFWGFGPAWGLGPCWNPFGWGPFGGFGVPYTPINTYLPDFAPLSTISTVPSTQVTVPQTTVINTTTQPVQQQTYTINPSPIYTGLLHPDKSIFSMNYTPMDLDSELNKYYKQSLEAQAQQFEAAAKAQQQYTQQQYAQQTGQPQTYQQGTPAQGVKPSGSVHDTFKALDSLLGKNQPAPAQTGSPSFGNSWGVTSPQQRQQDTSITTQNSQGVINTPNWYEIIVEKTRNGEPLTDSEKTLKATFEKMYNDKKYNPYRVNQWGYSKDQDGTLKRSEFGNKVYKLMKLLSRDQGKNAKKILDKCSPEELAAIEFHFNVMTKEYEKITEGKTLREMIKDATNGTVKKYFKLDNKDYTDILGKLDTAALNSQLSNPRNVAFALKEAIENYNVGSLGFDQSRISKLLEVAAKKGENFKDAVIEEFEKCSADGIDLGAALEDKWNKTDKTHTLMQEWGLGDS